ncbi:putative AC transposase [Sesbania bispinosa]|nr:putative AC transposase [Sesbania bispinosa]
MSSLGDPMDSPFWETVGHSISTMPWSSGTATPLPPRNNRSTAWDHFTVESGDEKKEGKVGGGVGSSPTYFKFDQELCRTELVKMFMVVEFPFQFVETEAF